MPAEQTVWFPFDGLLRRPKWYGTAVLLKPVEAKEQGLPQVRPSPARGPEVADLAPADVSEVVRLAAGASRGEREVLRVLSIEKRTRQLLPAIALVYRALQGDTVQVGFAIDGRLSHEHELAFARGGGLGKQPIFDGLEQRVRPGPVAGALSGRAVELVEEAQAQKNVAAGVTTARSRADRAASSVAVARTDEERAGAALAAAHARDELVRAEAELRNVPVRLLPVYEHPAILENAVGTAIQRVLIMSPWIRKAVVDEAFLRAIRRACGRGVTISIAYGLGEGDPGEKPWDADAREGLERLAAELPRLLRVRRLGDTHAKVLVKDSEYIVITSFNWLSFRGDPSKPFREERGALVSDPALVDQFYSEITGRFQE